MHKVFILFNSKIYLIIQSGVKFLSIPKIQLVQVMKKDDMKMSYQK
jgi:hypothetical protein